MTVPVLRTTIHHRGDGDPGDGTWPGSDPYSILIGTTRLTIQQSPFTSWATFGFNHVSLDLCFNGNRMVDPVTDDEIALVREACNFARHAAWLAAGAMTFPHGTLHPPPAPYPTGSSPTDCPGIDSIDRWPEIVAATMPSVPLPVTPEAGAMEIVSTPSGLGYYIVDSTGAVFAYGDAVYHGGMNTQKLNAPIVGMTLCPGGYWLLAKDGGVFSFGAAKFYGAPTGKVH